MFLRLGSVPTVVVSSSDIAKQFLKTHDMVFANRPSTATGKYISYNFKGVILTPYGDYWKRVRKLCVTELLSAKRIESFKHVREEEVSAMIRSIWEESGSGTIAVNLSKAFFTLTTNIIWRIMAGKKLSNDDFGGDGKGFSYMVSQVVAAAGAFSIGDFIPYLEWLDLQGIHQQTKEATKIFDSFAEKVIDDHIENRFDSTSHGEAEAEAEHDKGFVDVLLQIQSEQQDAKIGRETIKAIIFVSLSGVIPSFSSLILKTRSTHISTLT